MSERTNPAITSRNSQSWEARLVTGSVALLSVLAVADRLFAWLIGEFPTASMLWHIRFEYLRPIAVYHALAESNFGSWSPWNFSLLVVAAGSLIAGGALSGLRLARAVSYHLLLGAAVILVVLCFDTGLAIQPRAVIGTPSDTYFLLGALLTSMAAMLCLRIHAEYIGWKPRSSRVVWRLRLSVAGMRSNIEAKALEILDQLNPNPNRSWTTPAFIRADRRRYHGARQFTPDR